MTGMVCAALDYTTVAKGRLATLYTSAAESAPGVILVMTRRNAPRMKPGPVFGTSAKAAAGDDLPIMQDDRIHWNGQPIALVLAETQEQADHAQSLIRATYEVEPASTAFEEAKAHARHVPFYGQPLKNEIGDAEAHLPPRRTGWTSRTVRRSKIITRWSCTLRRWCGTATI